MSILQKQDWFVLGAGAALSVIAGVYGQLGMATLQQELAISYATVIPIIPALVFIYLAQDMWGGAISRSLELTGAGLAIHLLIWIPHIQWHVRMEEGASGVMLGMEPSFWYVFFHGFSLLAFALMSYGFYLFWKEGTE